MTTNTTPDSVWQNPWHFIAFGFGSGAMPFAPGTFGTAMAIPFYLLIQNTSLITYSIILLLATIFGIWLCQRTETDIGVHDHPGIVFDEFVGYGLTMLAAPKGWPWVILGFFLFRVFDIWKPQPIRFFDEHVQNGFGTMLDDILAAIPAFIVLQLIARLYLRA